MPHVVRVGHQQHSQHAQVHPFCGEHVGRQAQQPPRQRRLATRPTCSTKWTHNSARTRSTGLRRLSTRYCPVTTQTGSTHRAKQWAPFTSPIRFGETETIGATRHGPCYPTSPKNYSRAAQQPRWSPPVGKEKRGIMPLPNWHATRRSSRPAVTRSVPGGGTDAVVAVQSASLNGPSLSSGFPPGLVVPPPGRCHCYPDQAQHTTLLNHANTVSVEDNLRKRSYSHSPANGTITATTSLHAWCRDNISVRAVA
jgi:hypothetical protein